MVSGIWFPFGSLVPQLHAHQSVSIPLPKMESHRQNLGYSAGQCPAFNVIRSPERTFAQQLPTRKSIQLHHNYNEGNCKHFHHLSYSIHPKSKCEKPIRLVAKSNVENRKHSGTI